MTSNNGTFPSYPASGVDGGTHRGRRGLREGACYENENE